MPAYLARLRKDKQLVGIYFVEHDGELFWLVDECCDPGEVEIAALGSGGVYWSNSIDFTVPISEAAAEAPGYDGLPSGASFSEVWAGVFYADDEQLNWQDVPLGEED